MNKPISPISFRHIADYIPHMISIYDYDGTILYINKLFAGILMKKADEVIGKNLLDIAPAGYGKKFLAIMRRVMDTGEAFREVLNIVFILEEKTFDFRILPLDSEIPGKRLAFMMGQEINPVGDIIMDARTSITNLGYLIKNSPNAIVVLDLHGYFLFANEQASFLTGYSHEELMKLNMSQVSTKEDLSNAKQRIKRKLEGTENQSEYVTRIRMKSGEYRIVEIKSTLTTWMNGKAILIIASDFTEKKQMEEDLRIQRQAADILALNDNFSLSLKKLANLIKTISWVKGGGFYLVNKEKGTIKLIYHFNLPLSFIKTVREFPLDHQNIKAIMQKKSLYLNYRELTGIPAHIAEEMNIDMVCVLPLVQNNELIGSLNLTIAGKNVITDAEKTTLESLASRIGEMLLRVKAREELARTVENIEKRFIERTARLRELNKTLFNEIRVHKQTRKALQIAEEKFRKIQDNIPLGLFRTDLKGRLHAINPACIKIFGYASVKEMLKIPVTDLYFDPDERDKALGELMRNGVIEGYEIWLKKKNGDPFWGSIDAKTIRDEQDNLLYFDGAISDISSKKKIMDDLANAHEEIKKINENLEKRINREIKKLKDQQNILIQKSKLESLGELSTGIAHEINQPLGLITMALENMYLHVNEGKATREYIKRKMDSVILQVNRIQKIIDHIRVFSRDQQSISLEKIDLNQTVYNALLFVGAQYRNHGVEIKLDLQPNPGFTVGNRHKLEQVIMNLLSNAKYAVDARAKNMEKESFKKMIRISTYTEFSSVFLRIEDNGIGISPENMRKIFDPFFTTKDEDKGTGLGLSIVYGIIKEMKGEIQFRSKESEYTRVLAKFPLVAE